MYDIMVEHQGPCNYRCWYCVGPGTGSPYPLKLHDLAIVQTFYDKLEEAKTTYYCRGTEPAIHPQTCELVSIAAPVGPVVIRTNFSMPVEQWLPGPHNVQLLVTIHPEAEQDMDGFLERLLSAQEQGYVIRLSVLVIEGDRPDLRERLGLAGVRYPLTVGKATLVRLPETQPELVGIKLPPKKKAPPPEPYPPQVLCRAGYDSCAILYRPGGGTRICRCGNAAGEIESRLPEPALCTQARPGSKFCKARVVV